jgi:hypothetical protein
MKLICKRAKHEDCQFSEFTKRAEYEKDSDPKRWSTVLITALGSWEKPVPHGHALNNKEWPRRINSSCCPAWRLFAIDHPSGRVVFFFFFFFFFFSSKYRY